MNALEYLNVGIYTQKGVPIFAFKLEEIIVFLWLTYMNIKPIQDNSHLLTVRPVTSRLNMNSQRYRNRFFRLYLPAIFVVFHSTIPMDKYWTQSFL